MVKKSTEKRKASKWSMMKRMKWMKERWSDDAIIL